MLIKRIRKAVAVILVFTLVVSILPLDSLFVSKAATTKMSEITGWNAVYATNNENDFLQDQQTGSGSVSQDIVGDETHPAVYMKFTDDAIAFKVRVSNIDGTNPFAFKNFAWVGIDADVNGSIDFFLGMYNPTGNNGRLGVYMASTGSKYTNLSPSTTGINGKALFATQPVNDVNYYITPADTNFNGTQNYFVEFRFNVADIQKALVGTPYSGFDASTPFRFITGTASQDNSFNQDINGMDRSAWSSGATWESLNIYSDIVSADGTADDIFCSVRFDKNTGDTEADMTVNRLSMVDGSAVVGKLPTVNPTKRGMYFQEWNTAPDGSGETITAKAVVTAIRRFMQYGVIRRFVQLPLRRMTVIGKVALQILL